MEDDIATPFDPIDHPLVEYCCRIVVLFFGSTYKVKLRFDWFYPYRSDDQVTFIQLHCLLIIKKTKTDSRLNSMLLITYCLPNITRQPKQAMTLTQTFISFNSNHLVLHQSLSFLAFLCTRTLTLVVNDSYILSIHLYNPVSLPQFHCGLPRMLFYSLTPLYYACCISLRSAHDTTPGGLLSSCGCPLSVTLTTSIGIW